MNDTLFLMRIARAICRVAPPIPGQPPNSDAYVDQNWHQHEEQARAALLAMRPQIDALKTARRFVRGVIDSEIPEMVDYQYAARPVLAAIDKALEE